METAAEPTTQIASVCRSFRTGGPPVQEVRRSQRKVQEHVPDSSRRNTGNGVGAGWRPPPWLTQISPCGLEWIRHCGRIARKIPIQAAKDGPLELHLT